MAGTSRQNAPVRRPPAAPELPDDESENSRPRRAADNAERRTSAQRRDDSSARDDRSSSSQIRRVGRGMVSKIREIFEGKP